MPTKKSRGEALTLEEQGADQALHARQRRIEHVHSRVKPCRLVTDQIRLAQERVRPLVLERCCALHTCRVHLSP
jgi:hypothetical protein